MIFIDFHRFPLILFDFEEISEVPGPGCDFTNVHSMLRRLPEFEALVGWLLGWLGWLVGLALLVRSDVFSYLGKFDDGVLHKPPVVNEFP